MQPLQKLISSRIYILSLIEAVLAAACYVGAVFLIRPVDASIYLLYEDGAQHIGLVAAIFVITTYLQDVYKQIRIRSRVVLLLELLNLLGIMFLVHSAVAYIDPTLVAAQAVLLLGSVLTLIVLMGWRLFIRPVIWAALGTHEVVFVGVDEAVERLTEAFREQPTLGMHVIGFAVHNRSDVATATTLAPIVGTYADLRKIVSRSMRVIVAAELHDRSVLKTLFDLRSAGVTVESAGDAYEATFGRIYSRAVEPYTVIFRNDLAARAGSVALQSIYTNLVALAAVIVALPVIIVLAIVLKLARRGPAFDRRTCVGLHGVPFNLYRFNCSVNSHDWLSRFLLRFKLDALPEVLNIVRGEMALIGPRAERVEFSNIMDDLIPFYRQRRSVKPGVIGWSQLHCDVKSIEDSLARIEYDLFYLKHISLVLDAYIVLRAFKWVLTEGGNTAEPAVIRAKTPL